MTRTFFFKKRGIQSNLFFPPKWRALQIQSLVNGFPPRYLSSNSIQPHLENIPENLEIEDPKIILPPKPIDIYEGVPPMSISVKKFGTDENVDEITLDKRVFGVPIRRDIVHNVIKWERAKQRSGTAQTKRMKDLRGSTRKLRKQKGSGMARVGMNRRAGRVGGMKAHGPRQRDFSFKLNAKVVRLGQRVALSAKLKEKSITIVDNLNVSEPKTALVKNYLKAMDLMKRPTLIIGGTEFPQEFVRGSNNIPAIKRVLARDISVYDMIKHNNLLLTADAVAALQERLVERVCAR